jgi:hypothetical protein
MDIYSIYRHLNGSHFDVTFKWKGSSCQSSKFGDFISLLVMYMFYTEHHLFLSLHNHHQIPNNSIIAV